MNSKIEIALPKEVKYILDTLSVNYKGYVVGGCVRDSLLNKEPKDWDIATNATPTQVEELFLEGKVPCKVIPTGLQHGTITLRLNKQSFEITTFRTEGVYEDNRRPSSVEFVNDLCEDLKRRDFTINAFAYNEQEGLIDYFNGQQDLKDKIIRCVGDPNERFQEDGLRILRSIRFAAILGFDIEDKTNQAILDNSYLLNNISRERIQMELNKILLSNDRNTYLKKYYNIFKDYIFSNDFFIPHYKLSDLNVILYTCLIREKDKHKEILSNLKYDNNTINNVGFLFKCSGIMDYKTDNEIKIKTILRNKIPKELLLEFIKFLYYHKDHEEALNLNYYLNLIMINNECYSLSQLEINGEDLSELGFEGISIGRILNSILDLVIEGKLTNNRKEIFKYIKETRNV